MSLLNNQLLEKILETLYHYRNEVKLVELNDLLKSFNLSNQNIVSTMTYMENQEFISKSAQKQLNRKSEVENRLNNLDEIEIKTKILPNGIRFYQETYIKKEQAITMENPIFISGQKHNVSQTIIKSNDINDSTITQTSNSTSDSKKTLLEKISWAVAILVGAITIYEFIKK